MHFLGAVRFFTNASVLCFVSVCFSASEIIYVGILSFCVDYCIDFCQFRFA